MKINMTQTGIYVSDVSDDEIRIREKRARTYLTKKEIERRYKREIRRKAWLEAIFSIFIWALILLMIIYS